MRRLRPMRNSCCRSAPKYGSGTPWCGRLPTRPGPWRIAAPPTFRSPRRRTFRRTLTAEPGRRADRALAAALANLHAGAFDTALGLLAQAEADAIDDLQRARVEQLRGQIEWASVSGREAPVLLLQAAKRLESLDAGLARETYLHAWVASSLAGPLAGPGGLLQEVSLAARAALPPAGAPRPCDLLLDGLTAMIIQGRAAAEPTLRRAVAAFLGDQVSGAERLQWGILAQMATLAVWDFDSWLVLSTRDVELAS